VILVAIVFVPIASGLAAWLSERISGRLPRVVSLAGFIVDLLLVALLWGEASLRPSGAGPWIASFRAAWHPLPAVSFHLAADGVSLVLLALTAFLGCMAAAASWTEITERTGFFHLCLSWTVAGVAGVFCALDLFLFYFAWELMLVPMYFLIALWGHEDRFRAAVKFFIFTQVSGLLMLVAILGLYFAHINIGGVATFDYPALFATPLSPSVALLVQAGFLAAFLVKLPAVPFHTWLPDAHTQAPTAGSIVLAGLLLKTGAYGIIRFSVPLFAQAGGQPAFPLAVLGVASILYGALLAFGQNDVKRLVAYTSVSHMGFVLTGVVLGSGIAFQGAMIQIVSHGLSTGALFVMAGILQERLGTRDMGRMGAFWTDAPRMGGFLMCFALASMGLPGLGNFVGEFLVVLGAYRVSPALAAFASAGFIFSTAYSLRLVHRVFFGERKDTKQPIADLSGRETAVMLLMLVPLLWLGLAPQGVIDRVKGSGTVQAAAKDGHAAGHAPVAAVEARDVRGGAR
jgi:NADH-quinone oxidoreductase subunit M